MKTRLKKIPIGGWAVIVLLVAIPVLAWVYTQSTIETNRSSAVYRVRVTVIDPQGTPVEDAKVWSSFGGEPKRVAGGWQFDIPAAIKPTDGHLTIFASKESAFVTGQSSLYLSNDYNPSVLVNLARKASARVRGQVVDNKNRSIIGALVFVVGYEAEAVTTQDGGSFELAAHAAVNQSVKLYAEKKGYKPATQWHPAGDHPVTLVLER